MPKIGGADFFVTPGHPQESSPSVQDSFRTTLPHRNMAYMSVYMCILPSVTVYVLLFAVVFCMPSGPVR